MTVRVCSCDHDGNSMSCSAEAYVLPASLSRGALIAILACIFVLLGEWSRGSSGTAVPILPLFEGPVTTPPGVVGLAVTSRFGNLPTSERVHPDVRWTDQSTSLPTGLWQTLLICPSQI